MVGCRSSLEVVAEAEPVTGITTGWFWKHLKYNFEGTVNFAFEMQMFLMNNQTKAQQQIDFISEVQYELFIPVTVVLALIKGHSGLSSRNG